MYKLAIVTTFGYALSSIATSFAANNVGLTTAIVSILMTTCVTEVVLYLGE